MIEIPQSFFLTDPDTPFAEVSLALKEPNGLIGVGGELTTERLIEAYQQGIFPWYSEDAPLKGVLKRNPILWYSPDPRMIITPSTLHISKSLQKLLNKNNFEIKVDQAFKEVIHHCKVVERKDQTGTWIDNNMVDAYITLHKQGVARSVEVYQDSKLVGGLYGVSMGKVFFGESMFSLVQNTSKIAFVYLIQTMGYELIDCQVENPHLESLGAFNIECSAFIKLLKNLL
ncbi:Leucyl/phenylalanyl-tRNA--protein transferase [uncultured Candidatus Thioglobus sp.]|nr:Leucyl/phenylalanyl-tRNA--protein transferase [uncultured Candidatus Thioglobus sp.]